MNPREACESWLPNQNNGLDIVLRFLSLFNITISEGSAPWLSLSKAMGEHTYYVSSGFLRKIAATFLGVDASDEVLRRHTPSFPEATLTVSNLSLHNSCIDYSISSTIVTSHAGFTCFDNRLRKLRHTHRHLLK